jgi:hypothetical protein
MCTAKQANCECCESKGFEFRHDSS